MTVNVNNIYELGLLAEASYAWFDKIDYKDGYELLDLLTGKEIKDVPTEKKADFSKTQAEDFIANYEIVSHLPDTISDYSATVFRRKNPQDGEPEYVFSCRGTAGLLTDVLGVDVGDIVANGAAWEQIVDQYNYWQRLITPIGQTCKQAYFDNESLSIAHPDFESSSSDILKVHFIQINETSEFFWQAI